MIYAIVELQNPFPRKTMLWKGDMNISVSRSDTFLQRQGFQLATQHCMMGGGEGACTPIAGTKKGKDPEIFKRHWCSNYFW